MESLHITTLNVKSIRSSIKWAHLITFLDRNNTDIILLQEVNTEKPPFHVENLDFHFFFNGPTSQYSGTAIGVRKSLLNLFQPVNTVIYEGYVQAIELRKAFPPLCVTTVIVFYGAYSNEEMENSLNALDNYLDIIPDSPLRTLDKIFLAGDFNVVLSK